MLVLGRRFDESTPFEIGAGHVGACWTDFEAGFVRRDEIRTDADGQWTNVFEREVMMSVEGWDVAAQAFFLDPVLEITDAVAIDIRSRAADD